MTVFWRPLRIGNRTDRTLHFWVKARILRNVPLWWSDQCDAGGEVVTSR